MLDRSLPQRALSFGKGVGVSVPAKRKLSCHGRISNKWLLSVGVLGITALLFGIIISFAQFTDDIDESATAENDPDQISSSGADQINPETPAQASTSPSQDLPSNQGQTPSSANPADPDAADPGAAGSDAAGSASADPDAAGPSPADSGAAQLPANSAWVDPQSAGQPWGGGLLTFRGSPTRSWYGTGPLPTQQPSIKWVYPSAGQGRLCSISSWQGQEVEWCGTGWTGQPAVFEYRGMTWVVVGTYDGAVHFINAANGQQIIPPFQTDDLIKGSVTIDPDGYPLVYFGSRDNNFRVVAFDRPEPQELWRLNAYEVSPRYWNDDWDSSALVLGDYLFEGGENSNFHIVKLNRGYDQDGQVVVSPRLEHHFPGWDQELLDSLGDTELSIETSVAISGNVMYFANSGGLVQGWDLTGLGTDSNWQPQRIFRFWVGDDVDATITIDEEGMLYVAVERERTSAKYEVSAQRTEAIGQLLKLDPSQPADPIVWSVKDLVPLASNPPHLRDDTGFWATPAIYGEMVYAASNTGRLLGIDRQTGGICWEKQFDEFLWSSPVVVDGVLLQAGSVISAGGGLASYLWAYDVRLDGGCGADVASTPGPSQLWAIPLGWRVESTPAVWEGSIYLGDRNGYLYAIN